MAFEVVLEISGVEELVNSLETFNEEFIRGLHMKLLHWALAVREYARSLAPVRTGYLRSSIYAEVKSDVKEHVTKFGAKASYAIYVEFGTRYMRAKPYLYPAVQEYLPELERVIIEAIEEAKKEAGFE